MKEMSFVPAAQTIVNAEGAATQNTITAAATGQASSATNANANPANAAAPQPDGYIENRFKSQLSDLQDQVATGASADDINKIKTGGRENQPVKLKKAIQREYWNNAQVTGVFFLALSVGIFAIAVWVSSDNQFVLLVDEEVPGQAENPDNNAGENPENPEENPTPQRRNEDGGETGEEGVDTQVNVGGNKIQTVEPVFNLFSKRGLYTKIAMFIFGFFVASRIGQRVPHGIRKCKGTPRKPGAGVMSQFAGHQCLTDGDCTTSNREVAGACASRNIGAFGNAIYYIGWLSALGLLLLLLEDPEPATPVDYALGFLFGFSGGYIVDYYVVH